MKSLYIFAAVFTFVTLALNPKDPLVHPYGWMITMFCTGWNLQDLIIILKGHQ